ncbi:GNAT family N-acetyltransferase [Nocardia coubleae]|uniref:GNAT family N-acetyltransferase n=1 Tax=Nocardia coubleae TaxID=356147 RepID=A0A846W101_9NOCA|nr:GNAT family N-acetyltransferase [Nocardia coubleae]NKX86510.1 GNAT family N-acetyltransferase [Nocardia coubleae]
MSRAPSPSCRAARAQRADDHQAPRFRSSDRRDSGNLGAALDRHHAAVTYESVRAYAFAAEDRHLGLHDRSPAAPTPAATGQISATANHKRTRRGNIGYWILDRHRGLGYAKSAVALLTELGTELGFIRLEALIEPGNTASQTVCNTCGFVREGMLSRYHRIDGSTAT